jgi:hypothetical protein
MAVARIETGTGGMTMDRKHHRKIGYAFAFGTIICLIVAAPLAAAGSILVVQVTQNDVVDAEPSIAINPLDSKNVVAGWISGTTESFSCTYGASFDGGRSWKSIGPVPGMPPPFSGDPSVVFDKDGNVYFSCGVNTGPAGRATDFVSRSTDGGVTWGAPVAAFTSTDEFKGVDFTKISANPVNGDIYVVTQLAFSIGQGGIFFTRSTDHGASFSAPIRINRPSDGSYPDDPYAVGVDSSTVYVTYGVGSNANQNSFNYDRIFLAKSTDGGATFSAGLKVLDVVPLPTYLPNFSHFHITDTNLWSAVDRRSGEIYVNFVDYRNGDADVWLLRVRDTGDAFVPDGVVRVNDDPVGNGADQFYPFLSVAPNGRVDICFLDRRYATGNNLLFTSCAYSSDAGLTFTNVQVTTVGFDASNNIFIQDYEWQASTDRFVMPIFIRDGFSGADWFGQEVFVARVTL